jgi:hypothetical protein
MVAQRNAIADRHLPVKIDIQWRGDLTVLADSKFPPDVSCPGKLHAAENHGSRSDMKAKRAIESGAEAAEAEVREQAEHEIEKAEAYMKHIDLATQRGPEPEENGRADSLHGSL